MRDTRRSEFYIGSHWLPSVLGGIVVLVLVMYLIEALDRTRDQAERTMVEMVVRNMKIGMQIAKIQGVSGNNKGSVSEWEGSNPIRWLEEAVPSSYQGVCNSVQRANLPPSTWCFDERMGELVFRPRDDKVLRVNNENGVCRELAWKVTRNPDGVFLDRFDGWQILPSGACRWRN